MSELSPESSSKRRRFSEEFAQARRVLATSVAGFFHFAASHFRSAFSRSTKIFAFF